MKPPRRDPLKRRRPDELGDPLTSFEAVTGYNNYYEFSMDKEAVAPLASGLQTAPWTVAVGGLVNKPRTFGVEDLLPRTSQEERIYRLRCVEAWSMVIPWLGFPLGELLKEVEPTSQAKYVRFETAAATREQMPGQRRIVATSTGPTPKGCGWTRRCTTSPSSPPASTASRCRRRTARRFGWWCPGNTASRASKSIVKIDLVEEMPISFWMASAPKNTASTPTSTPRCPTPRWSQASERRIGELTRRRTLPFNGYAEQVAGLYTGMDLRTNY